MNTRGDDDRADDDRADQAGRDHEPHEKQDKDTAMDTDTSEQRLREALNAVNDLEPPRDDLFAARALNRGRARTARRRSALLGAAAAVIVVGGVGGVGGVWTLSQNVGTSTSSMAAGAPVQDQSKAGAGGSGEAARAPGPISPGQPTRTLGSDQPGTDGLTGGNLSLSARDTSQWLRGPVTAQRIAFDAIAPTLAARWPDVFSGAYAADATNARIVVAVVRPDPALESFVRGAMPTASDVQFVTAANSLATKQKVATEIAASAVALSGQGVDVTGIRLDGRTDRVVVTTATGSTPGVLEQRYGTTMVTVVVSAVTPPAKLPNGATLPPLQR
ncbi:hypothetical protein BA895_05195 [Humibacillus sp. DSM 29435]|uniref:hypothetical protein n=1 Tax=Humibacillus sp. DSM 29435 TaxID=1869167 RepID=UPI0008732025|nr:hypothetical protein [Humibacillus sp. DSM 29435]OFE15903.1 hypothetical protein BA895_05195 [Humibacillus sp. DSM 29435]